MNKQNLKDDMILTSRSGEFFTIKSGKLVCKYKSVSSLCQYKDSLKHKYSKNADIVKINYEGKEYIINE